MDGIGGFGGGHETTASSIWDWEGDIYCNENPLSDITPMSWDDINPNEDGSFFYSLGNQTPARDCEDFSYGAVTFGDETSMNGTILESHGSSAKRRRMLQFTSSPNKADLGSDAPESSILNSMVIESSSLSSSTSRSLKICSFRTHNNADQFSGGWWQKNSGETMTPYSPLDTSCSRSSNVSSSVDQNVSGLRDAVLEVDSKVERETTKLSTLKIFRGQKSAMKPAEKAEKIKATVAFPFTLIKPWGEHKGTTLQDINQQVNTPLKKDTKDKDQEHLQYPTSAFSGKPVTSKTTIPTRGGKGSITIVRTKG